MKKEKTARDFIIEGTVMLMRKKPYEEITITAIAERAGVNRVTFYRYFDSKDEVVEAYLTECDERNLDCEGDNLYIILKYFEQNREMIDTLYSSHAEHLLVKHIMKKWGYCEPRRDHNDSSENLVAYVQSAWSYFVFGWANEWYRRGMKETPEELLKVASVLQKAKTVE